MFECHIRRILCVCGGGELVGWMPQQVLRSSVCCELTDVALQQIAVLEGHVKTLITFARSRLNQFVSVCRLTPRGHRMKCSPRFARRWSPVPPSDFLNTAPTLNSSVQEVHHSKETHLHPHNLPPAPNTCSLNSSGSHVPPNVLKHSQHSAKPLSAFDTDEARGCHILLHLHCLSLTSTSIYAANCQEEADNCTENTAFPAVTESVLPDECEISPELGEGSHHTRKRSCSACVHALMHSNVLYIVTSMQVLQSSLTAFCAFNKKAENNQECWRIMHLYVSKFIVQVLV